MLFSEGCTRILRRTSAKCRRLEKPVSLETTVARLTDDCRGVWRRRDAPRAARHSRRDNESSSPLQTPEFAPFSLAPPSVPPTLCDIRISLFPRLKVRCSLGETQRKTAKKRDLPVTLADNVQRERRVWSTSRRRRHAASLCARLRLGTLPRYLCGFSPPRTRMQAFLGYTKGYIKSGWF